MEFTKRFLHFAGISVPAIQIGPDVTTIVTLPSGKRRPQVFAEMLSLREGNPDGPNAGTTYLQVSPENKAFTTLRFTNVVGLDVSEDGTMLTVEDLEKQRALQITSRQQAARPALQTLELDEIED